MNLNVLQKFMPVKDAEKVTIDNQVSQLHYKVG